MAGKIVELTKSNFEKEAMQADTPVVIDFWASWCNPCKMFASVFSEASEKYSDKIKFCKVNVDEQEELSLRFKVMSIPMILILKNGEIVDKTVGAMGKDAFEKMLDNALQ